MLKDTGRGVRRDWEEVGEMVAMARARDRVAVLLIDDHAVLRQGLRSFLEGSGLARVVGEGVDGADAARLASLLEPDVVVMDLVMAMVDGVTATRCLRAKCPGTAVVVLTADSSAERTNAALAAGACAVILKGVPSMVLLTAILAAADA